MILEITTLKSRIFYLYSLFAVLFFNVFDVNILTYMEIYFANVQGIPRNMTVARLLDSRALNF